MPAITDIAMLDGDGRERVFVSRVSINRLDERTDRSGDAAFVGARSDGVYFGPGYFRRDTEPFMTIAVAGTRREAGVVVAEVNLKYPPGRRLAGPPVGSAKARRTWSTGAAA